ncbi:DoxX family protein [Pelagibacteraceae bacterium]|nr:DoxX family protein [Pelagibacteraceae bacterium]
MYILEFVGRVLISALFLIEGTGKIPIQEDVIMYMEDYGVPGILFMPATILEILFPLLLIVGYKTKWAASVMALFTFTVAVIFHTDFSEGTQMIFFLKDLAIAGGFMFIVVYGPSKISLDYYFKSKRE